MMSRRIKFSKWVILAMALLFLSGCIGINSARPVSSHTDFQVLSVQALYSQAREIAIEWQEDAYLYQVILDLVPLTDTEAPTAFFSFRSYNQPLLYFGVVYEAADIPKTEKLEGEFDNPRPSGIEIDPDTLAFDSLDVFKIMYQQLGGQFYSSCETERWPSLLILEQRVPGLGEGELVWKTTYGCSSPEKAAAIFIDAETGEVLEIRQ